MIIIDQAGPLLAGYYLLENIEDYRNAIMHYLELHKHNPVNWGMQSFDLDSMVQLHRIKGNRHCMEHGYPLVLVVNYIDDPDQLIVNFIPKQWFEVSDA